MKEKSGTRLKAFKVRKKVTAFVENEELILFYAKCPIYQVSYKGFEFSAELCVSQNAQNISYLSTLFHKV